MDIMRNVSKPRSARSAVRGWSVHNSRLQAKLYHLLFCTSLVIRGSSTNLIRQIISQESWHASRIWSSLCMNEDCLTCCRQSKPQMLVKQQHIREIMNFRTLSPKSSYIGSAASAGRLPAISVRCWERHTQMYKPFVEVHGFIFMNRYFNQHTFIHEIISWAYPHKIILTGNRKE